MKKISLRNKIVLSIVLFGTIWLNATAQSDDIDISLSGDLVSSYVWRGLRQTGASVQPALGATYKSFSLESWASTDLSNKNFKEVDFTASYATKGFRIALTDYWWDGEGAANYFGGKSKNGNDSGHMLEGTLNYTFTEKFPLTLSWNTFFIGKGNKKENGKNSYSTFVEASYPFKVKNMDIELAIGVTPWESVIYQTEKFSATQIKLHLSKTIQITDKFSVPIFGNIIFNPDKGNEDVNFVFGITIN